MAGLIFRRAGEADHVAIEDLFRALLSAALAGNDSRLLLLGLSAADPLAAALGGLKARKEYGRHFLVGLDGAPPVWKEPFAFDAARI
jgi:CelD/BcsL family acetyltransferase involved in cellulose biosynthesis